MCQSSEWSCSAPHTSMPRKTTASNSPISFHVLRNDFHTEPLQSNAQLLLELEAERGRRMVLEQRVQDLEQSIDHRIVWYKDHLRSEVDSAILSRGVRPDSVHDFSSFSMDAVVQELQKTCPDLCHLLQQLGSTRKNESNSKTSLTGEDLKVVMSACTLLNARSTRARGLQLMISLMLIARSTSKQVKLYYYTS